jgi:DNA polymerase
MTTASPAAAASARNSLFANRDFSLLFGGSSISAFGDQFTLVALPWLVLKLTGSPAALGLVLAVMAFPRAAFMLIGEQPGLQEDREGLPFVGPAGRMLDRALAEVGIERTALFLTNTVKHFKYETRGTAKLHKRANAAEQAACRMWLAAELARVQPRLVVALGAMAAQTLFGNAFRLTRERGRWRDLDTRTQGMATWHPSAIVRAPADRRDVLYRELVGDLRSIAARS